MGREPRFSMWLLIALSVVIIGFNVNVIAAFIGDYAILALVCLAAVLFAAYRRGPRIFMSIIIALIALFAGFDAVVAAALSGSGYFYVIFAPVCLVAILFGAYSLIWGWFRSRTLAMVMAAIAGALVMSVAIVEAVKAYHAHIPQVSEQGVDLALYAPFGAGTKAASLGAPSTLKISDSLPRLDGALALYPVYAAFARAVYPEGRYQIVPRAAPSGQFDHDEVLCSNTVEAYKGLVDGRADMIFVAAPSGAQLAYAQARGVELKLTPIGREAFVFFVNARNPVGNLSVADVQKIYAGKIANWREVGGRNQSILAFQRPENSGSQTMLHKIMADAQLATPPSERVATGMGDILKVAAYRNYDGAIGYSFRFFATGMVGEKQIRMLSINGIPPTRETIRDGSYPYTTAFYAVTAGTKNPNVARLLEWILSSQGQELVEKTGYVGN